MKKTIAILLSLVLVMGIVSVMAVSAAEESKITVHGTECSVKAGDTVTYTINLTTPEVIENGQFIIYYPGSVLTVDSVTYGDAVKAASLISNYTGADVLGKEIDFNFSDGQNGIDLTKGGLLVEVKFTVTGEGTGEVKMNIGTDEGFICNMKDQDITALCDFDHETSITTTNNDEPAPVVKEKKANTITVKAATKSVKLKKLKKKNQTVKPFTVKKAKGKVTYKITKATAKIKKLVKINSKGAITFKKWKKAKKGTYKVKVQIKAAGNTDYKSKTVTKTVKIKVK